MKQTFAQIDALAAALPFSDLSNRIQTMIAEAKEGSIILGGDALSHLENSLCFCEDMAICQWFAENDVAW